MKQLSIFKADQLQHLDSIVGVFKKPYTDISACMLAPLPILCLPSGCNNFSQYPVKVRCLAVDDSGQIVVAPVLQFYGDIEGFFLSLSNRIQQVRKGGWVSQSNTVPFLMEQVTTLEFWNLHEKTTSSITEQWGDLLKKNSTLEIDTQNNLHASLKNKIHESIGNFIESLSPEVLDLITIRPDLDLTIISSYMCRVKYYGGNALAYVVQALRVEPLPILRLIACEENSVLIETVFSGASLPKALSKHLEVNPTIIKHLSRTAMAIPDMSTMMFISSLEVLGHLEYIWWPETKDRWHTLVKLIEGCHLTREDHIISDGGPWVVAVATSLKLTIKPYSWQNAILKHFESNQSLEKITIAIYKKLYELIPKLRELPILEGVICGEQKQNVAYQFAISLLDKNPRQFCKQWLSCFPNIKPIYINDYQFDLVNSIEVCHYYGKVFNNCLQNDEDIMPNLFPNKLLFCISSNSKALALCTVSIRDVDYGIDATCHQLKGVGNSEVDEGVKKASMSFMDELLTDREVIRDFLLLSNAIVVP